MIATVDPGISGTGVAIWTNDWQFIKGFNIYTHNKDRKDWVKSCLDIVASLKELTKGVTTSYIEYPAFFSSVGGEMVAKKGDLLKLTFLVGLIYASFNKSHLVPVNRWKGQLPKSVVEKRIRRILGDQIKDCKSHTLDSIGIGLAIQGRLNKWSDENGKV